MLKSLFKNKYSKWIFFLLLLVALGIADYYAHGYYNTHGYRGKIAEDKQDNEYRIACFGGSITFGFWVEENESWPAQLQQILPQNYSVVNLGANSQGIYGISNDIDSYEYLNYDMAILYQGETDKNPIALNDYDFRGSDPLFYAFGYKTILGFYTQEFFRKAISKVVDSDKPEFKKESNTDSLKKELLTYTDQNNETAKALLLQGKKPFKNYIEKLDEVLTKLTERKVHVALVCQPNSYDLVQQILVRELIEKKFKNKVEYINLSDLFEDINTVSFDGMHLKKEGYKIVAEKLKAELFK
jgi:lysophospholipase L1-like esterase